ncbi:MAG: dienelactone hydrolase family protein [Ardenticatenaceae bacterium]|nr:dienelactone hydrolase family protein [Ardenticatenaceae bacterium]
MTPVPTIDMTPVPTIEASLPQEAGVYKLTLEDGQRYVLSLPEGYDSGEAWPLVLALHYAGEVTPWYGRGVLAVLVEPALRELQPIIVAPDARHGVWGSEAAEADVLALLDYITANYSIAEGKTLITGFSLGGMGTWSLAARNQERFAAAIPIAGEPQGDTLRTVWEIPLYVIYSEADEVVNIRMVEPIMEQLQAQGTDITFVAVPNLSHYAMVQFVPVLQEAVPWLEQHWQ